MEQSSSWRFCWASFQRLSVAQSASTPQPVRITERNLGGPRLGFTLLPSEGKLRERLDRRGIGTIISQFGWHWEHHITTFDGGPAFITEWIFLVGGVEYGTLIPGLTLTFGIRLPQGFEFGLGPNLLIGGEEGAMTALVIAVGEDIRFRRREHSCKSGFCNRSDGGDSDSFSDTRSSALRNTETSETLSDTGRPASATSARASCRPPTGRAPPEATSRSSLPVLPIRFSRSTSSSTPLVFEHQSSPSHSFVGAADVPIDSGTKQSADDRRHPEKPQLLDRPASDKHGDAGAARRVDGGVRHRDADQVDQRQAEADRDRRKPCGARLSVAPRMMSRNIMVMTTSLTSAATKEYPPGECAP